MKESGESGRERPDALIAREGDGTARFTDLLWVINEGHGEKREASTCSFVGGEQGHQRGPAGEGREESGGGRLTNNGTQGAFVAGVARRGT